jgi:hypothetical protein
VRLVGHNEKGQRGAAPCLYSSSQSLTMSASAPLAGAAGFLGAS